MDEAKNWHWKIGIIAAILFLSGCATMMPQIENITLKYKVPDIEPLKETSLNQEKGGILISIAPQHYTHVRKVRIEDVPSPGPLGGLIVTPGTRYFERRKIPYAIVEPDTLRFTVTIHNKLNHVFRGAGSVVSFNVDGKVMAVDEIGYRDFLNIIVPPQGQSQLKITGPLISSLPEKCVIGIFIYDVTTEVDAAGNPKKKSNYEWYFNFSTQLIEETEVIKAQAMQQTFY